MTFVYIFIFIQYHFDFLPETAKWNYSNGNPAFSYMTLIFNLFFPLPIELLPPFISENHSSLCLMSSVVVLDFCSHIAALNMVMLLQ